MNINEQISRIKQVMGLNEDTIGSYEREDLKQVAKSNANANAKSSTPQGGWWEQYPALKTIFQNGKLFKKIYYPLEASKTTGYITAWKNREGEYFYSFGPDMKFFIFEGLANWGKERKFEGTWKVDGQNIEITTADGDVWNSSTNAWIGTANADAQKAASSTGQYKSSTGFPLLYMTKGGEYISKLQTALGLKADGLFGPKTNQALVDKNIGYNANVGVTQDMYNTIVA
jgi:hypothetical protein